MEMALYEPGLGYYSAGARKFGASGDFITAPEVAPVFSRCVAAQCAEVLVSLGGGDVLEVGAGSGAMAAAMLVELEVLQSLPARYLILDVSADLRERQRETLAGQCRTCSSASVGWTGYRPAWSESCRERGARCVAGGAVRRARRPSGSFCRVALRPLRLDRIARDP